jgi:UDP-N-acetylmuramyl pentapeptide phosphotransferase/UDP-N-acetylglucosamine-1-phosphate transferase
MKVSSTFNKSVPVHFFEIENAECFIFAGHLWFKTTHIQGSSNAINLTDGCTKIFPSNYLVTKVDTQVTME